MTQEEDTTEHIGWFRAALLKLLAPIINWTLAPLNAATRLGEGARLLDVPIGELFADPIQTLIHLEDSPGSTYVWILGENASNREVEEFSEALTSAYIRHYGHQPRAAHFPIKGLEDLRQLTADEVRHYVKPWDREAA